AQTYESLQGPSHAREVGWALGTFHSLVSDLPTETLADTLPGFHNTPRYLEAFHNALASSTKTTSAEVKFCLNFIEKQIIYAPVLEEAKHSKKLFDRPIHGDPKVSNIMISKNSGLAVSIIDLDTVKPGLIHYDIGDCLRSGCNLRGEESDSTEQVCFDLDLCREILTGYLSQATNFLTKHDREYIFEAARIISFELGLRYFTDYLNNNIYFKVSSPTQNLQRALVQFHLTESIERQEKGIKALLTDLL
nr:phosphotransferase [Desulfobulbaceae bacterium]